jgi:hypothetical protein
MIKEEITMASFNAYKTFQGWIITATENGQTRYLQSVRNGEYRFHRNSLYARPVTEKTASKYLSDLLGMPFQITARSEDKMARIIRDMMKKGWDKDEAFLIADRIFRQYESNVMGMSILTMVKRQPSKAECI